MRIKCQLKSFIIQDEWQLVGKIHVQERKRPTERSKKRDQYSFRQRLTLFQKAYHVVSFSELSKSVTRCDCLRSITPQNTCK